MDMVRGDEEEEGGMYRDSNMKTYISIDSQRECAIRLREVKLGLCNNLEGWGREGGGRDDQVGGDVCISMTDSC